VWCDKTRPLQITLPNPSSFFFFEAPPTEFLFDIFSGAELIAPPPFRTGHSRPSPMDDSAGTPSLPVDVPPRGVGLFSPLIVGNHPPCCWSEQGPPHNSPGDGLLKTFPSTSRIFFFLTCAVNPPPVVVPHSVVFCSFEDKCFFASVPTRCLLTSAVTPVRTPRTPALFHMLANISEWLVALVARSTTFPISFFFLYQGIF